MCALAGPPSAAPDTIAAAYAPGTALTPADVAATVGALDGSTRASGAPRVAGEPPKPTRSPPRRDRP